MAVAFDQLRGTSLGQHGTISAVALLPSAQGAVVATDTGHCAGLVSAEDGVASVAWCRRVQRHAVWQLQPCPADPFLIAAVGVDPDVVLLRASAKGEGRTLRGHSMPVAQARWMPCGTRLVTAGLDGRLFLFNTATGAVELAVALPGPARCLAPIAGGGEAVVVGLRGACAVVDTSAPLRPAVARRDTAAAATVLPLSDTARWVTRVAVDERARTVVALSGVEPVGSWVLHGESSSAVPLADASAPVPAESCAVRFDTAGANTCAVALHLMDGSSAAVPTEDEELSALEAEGAELEAMCAELMKRVPKSKVRTAPTPAPAPKTKPLRIKRGRLVDSDDDVIE